MNLNRRDQIGHWVRNDQQPYKPCHHACCRGYRSHPDDWPVVVPARRLRSVSEDDLAARFRKLSWSDDPHAAYAELQILHEWDRRAKAEEKARDQERARASRQEAIAVNRAAARQEREAEYARLRAEAEAGTVGYLVNAKGRGRGISDAEILTGRRDVFDRYASDEAKDWFAAHPRPTAAYFRGQDTRVHARATERKRKRRGVMSR